MLSEAGMDLGSSIAGDTIRMPVLLRIANGAETVGHGVIPSTSLSDACPVALGLACRIIVAVDASLRR